MGSELQLAHTFKDHLAPFGLVQFIESPQESGIADAIVALHPQPLREGIPPPTLARVSWVEFKHEHGWPKRSTTQLKLKRFTREQLLFLESWARINGRACVLLQIDRDYLLFDARSLRRLFDGALRAEIEESAAMVVTRANAFPTARVLKWLTS